jgi:hypothetical protein
MVNWLVFLFYLFFAVFCMWLWIPQQNLPYFL